MLLILRIREESIFISQKRNYPKKTCSPPRQNKVKSYRPLGLGNKKRRKEKTRVSKMETHPSKSHRREENRDSAPRFAFTFLPACGCECRAFVEPWWRVLALPVVPFLPVSESRFRLPIHPTVDGTPVGSVATFTITQSRGHVRNSRWRLSPYDLGYHYAF